jgi:hypothetical protein
MTILRFVYTLRYSNYPAHVTEILQCSMPLLVSGLDLPLVKIGGPGLFLSNSANGNGTLPFVRLRKYTLRSVLHYAGVAGVGHLLSNYRDCRSFEWYEE